LISIWSKSGTLLLDPARDLSTAGFVDDPVARLKIPTEAEMRVLLADLPKDSLIQIRDWAILELIYSSALRIGEVRMLDVYDLDIESGVVHIRQAKGRKDRRVPLGRVAGRILHYWLDTIRPQLVEDGLSTALFVTLQGQRMQMVTLHARLRCLRERYGLPMGRFHSYRHASALHLLRGGADLRHVQELLGHSHVISTQIYTRLAPADLKEAHRKTHPRERHKGLKG
jgi:site-specific recombinase XerD